MHPSLFDEEISASQPLPGKWKWIRGLFVAGSCVPWFVLPLAWDEAHINTDYSFGLVLCWLIIAPLSFLLGILGPVLGRLETRTVKGKRFWWFATAFAATPLMVGVTLTVRNAPSLFGNN